MSRAELNITTYLRELFCDGNGVHKYQSATSTVSAKEEVEESPLLFVGAADLLDCQGFRKTQCLVSLDLCACVQKGCSQNITRTQRLPSAAPPPSNLTLDSWFYQIATNNALDPRLALRQSNRLVRCQALQLLQQQPSSWRGQRSRVSVECGYQRVGCVPKSTTFRQAQPPPCPSPFVLRPGGVVVSKFLLTPSQWCAEFSSKPSVTTHDNNIVVVVHHHHHHQQQQQQQHE